MKDEIKEILDYFVIHSTDEELEMLSKISVYITNLQVIEKEYSFLLSENAELENKITNLQDRIKELEQINEEHRKINGELREQYNLVCKISEERRNKWLSLNEENDDIVKIIKDYKSRIDKAIEYIKEDIYVEPKELYGLVDGEHLLNILQGKSDE